MENWIIVRGYGESYMDVTTPKGAEATLENRAQALKR